MSKKPSVTKQIADVLGTSNKVEQLEIVKQLVVTAQTPGASITVTLDRGECLVGVNSLAQISPEEMKYVLQRGIDEITKAVLKAEQQSQGMAQPQGLEDAEYVELDEPVAVPLNDSEIPDNMFSDPPSGVN
jgi:ATP-dependent 26S proteasome regulatory subunit